DHDAGVAYHMPAALKVSGPLDRAALRAALDRVVARHEILRTRFISIDGKPEQVIEAPDIGFDLSEHDLRASSTDVAARQACALRMIEAALNAPFDLATGPLIRGLLLRTDDDMNLLFINQHHIISDGWSIGVFVREITALYDAFSAGLSDPLPALEIQYADFAAWQRRHLSGDKLQRQIDFWTQHLRGAPALLELPTDHPRPPVQDHAGDFVPFALSEELTAALRALSTRHDVTPFMTLLAAWSLLMSRLSGQDDVTIGTPFANRQNTQVEPLLGLFVNTLALRVRLSEALDVAGLLARIKALSLDAYAHQDLPFEHVLEALEPVRSLS